ncbi:MAG: hypothetical protein K2R98_03365 [Gemmataceae bacterium]|nr:hypothetical protein [Gemmataceae bacterium]
MEAMSVEQMLLASWEANGFIGKTRVPIGSADLDAVATHPATRTVRIGEAKVRMGSQKVYVVDDWCYAEMHRLDAGFEWWMEEGWSAWLATLPRLWKDDGTSVIVWVPPVSEISEIQVVFCCNLAFFGADCAAAHQALGRAAQRSLSENRAVAERAAGIKISGLVKPTVDVVIDLATSVRRKIDEEGYGRRFGDPVKDLLRELHRFFHPALDRVPMDVQGNQLSTRKRSFADRLRKDKVLKFLGGLGISPSELSQWLTEDD